MVRSKERRAKISNLKKSTQHSSEQSDNSAGTRTTLSTQHSIHKIPKFPYKTDSIPTKKHTVVVGIGGNIGDTKRRFQKLFHFLKRDAFLDIVQTSSILQNPPFGYINQPDFYNAIMILKTNLSPIKLIRYLLKVEKKFKRQREFKNSPRTLDIDIIFYDKITYKKSELTLPHPKYKERDSVLLPLNEILKSNKILLKMYNNKLKS